MAMIHTPEMKKKKAYEIFEAKCSKMIESKFLLAQPCIASVLKCIINSPDLYQFIKDCLINIDCDAELYKATVSDTQNFNLPSGKRVMVALVTYLLNQFDNDEINLMEFISYYYNADTNIGYQQFCKMVIVPYISAIGDLFIGSNTEDNNKEEAETDVKINMAVYEHADTILKDMITELQADNNIEETERKELTLLTEGMMIALSNLDSKIIAALWVGMKYAFVRNKQLLKSLKELQKLFVNYLII